MVHARSSTSSGTSSVVRFINFCRMFAVVFRAGRPRPDACTRQVSAIDARERIGALLECL